MINTTRKRRGPRPRVIQILPAFFLADKKKQLKAIPSPSDHVSLAAENELNRRDGVSVSSNAVSDHDDYEESPYVTWEKDGDENVFVGFLGNLNKIEFDLPMSQLYPNCLFY